MLLPLIYDVHEETGPETKPNHPLGREEEMAAIIKHDPAYDSALLRDQSVFLFFYFMGKKKNKISFKVIGE